MQKYNKSLANKIGSIYDDIYKVAVFGQPSYEEVITILDVSKIVFRKTYNQNGLTVKIHLKDNDDCLEPMLKNHITVLIREGQTPTIVGFSKRHGIVFSYVYDKPYEVNGKFSLKTPIIMNVSF